MGRKTLINIQNDNQMLCYILPDCCNSLYSLRLKCHELTLAIMCDSRTSSKDFCSVLLQVLPYIFVFHVMCCVLSTT